MKFTYDDGGREAAGFKGQTGDCVCRAISIATGKPYAEVYDALNETAKSERPGACSRRRGGRSSARSGVHKVTQHKYLAALGWTWVPTMFIGKGCTVHLHDGELPMGRLIVAVSRHLCAVIDGVIHDTHDPQREAHTFRQFAGWKTAELKPGEQRNENGIWRISRRCVYGYFHKAAV